MISENYKPNILYQNASFYTRKEWLKKKETLASHSKSTNIYIGQVLYVLNVQSTVKQTERLKRVTSWGKKSMHLPYESREYIIHAFE